MKIVYKQTVADKIKSYILTAQLQDKEIDYIELTNTEARQLYKGCYWMPPWFFPDSSGSQKGQGTYMGVKITWDAA